MSYNLAAVSLSSNPALYFQSINTGEDSQVKDEETLVRGLNSRDPEAWAILYEECFPKIYRYVFVRIRNQAEAEDLAEQVFLKAIESGHGFKWRGAPVSSWLFRIARNLVIDYWRTDKSKRNQPIDEYIVNDKDDDPQDAAQKNSDIQRLIEAVGQLTRAQREVIELRFAGEMSTAEVARILGKSQGAVKVLQHNALAALRKRLDNFEGI